jgi:predicted unusual protein kinase regulating ubiquinone biosynthesis (AarF/ABC1/UbiB family)
VVYIIPGGVDELEKNGATLAKDARIIMEKLGPTYIKMGQMLSVRPDVLPPAALKELAILQDGVKAFPTEIALKMIEAELGRPIAEVRF